MPDESVQVESSAEPVSEPATEQTPVAPLSGSEAVLVRYRADMRRSRIIYAAVLAVILAGLGTWVVVTWSRGEAAHASLHTVSAPPRPLPLATPSPTQQQAWQTRDRLALGTPQYRGTVITYSDHTVRGRDARAGAATWAYTRTDRTVCAALQLTDPSGAEGTTIAVYEHKGNCDQLSAFNSQTGQRRWTRTLDMDGMPLDGHPIYRTTPGTMLLATSSLIYAIDPFSGITRWTYYRFGCTINDVALGDAGALISQDCSAQVNCSNEKFCARGPQLTLRNGSDSREDDADDLNHDRIIWNHVGNTDIPVSADNELVSAVDPGGTTLHVYSTDKGGPETGSLTLTPVSAQLGPVTAEAMTDGEIIWLSGRTYAIGSDLSEPLWTSESAVPPTVQPANGDLTPILATARITAPTSEGVDIINGSDGEASQQIPLSTPLPVSAAYSFGTGFLLSGSAGVYATR